MTLKHVVKYCLILLMAMILPSFSWLSSNNQIILRLANGVSLDHATHLAALDVARIIDEKTQGRIRLEVYGNMQFGQEIDLVKQLQSKTLDIAIVSTGPLPMVNPDVSVLDLPFLFNSEQQAYQAWDGPPGNAVLASLRKSGLNAVCFWENGVRCITSNRPITKPGDLRGLKIRVMQNPVYMGFFNKLEAVPTPMPWGDVLPALRSGLIEAQENPIPIIYYYHLDYYQRYLILTRHSVNPQIVLTGQSFNEKLTAADRELVFSVFHSARTAQRRLVAQQTKECLKNLKDSGMEIINCDTAGFKKAGKLYSQELLKRYKPEIRNYFLRYLQ